MATTVLSASISFGQQATIPFWTEQGTTLRDLKGNITHTEIKDAKAFTVRVYDRARWVTYHYEPNSTKVIKVEAPDTTDDYLYDHEQWNGRTVHAQGRAHTIHVADNLVVADNMPPVTIERDNQGRDSVVRRGTEVVATIQYAPNGQVRQFTIGPMTLYFEQLANGARETLKMNGAPLIETVARAEGKHQFPTSLDPVADRLGLPSDWRNNVHFNRSTTGSLTSVFDTMDHPLLDIIQMGGMGAAFDVKNVPLFYDLRLNYVATPASKRDAGDAFADVTTLLSGVLPDGLIVPVTGDASAYVSRPRDGAISSIWTVSGALQSSPRFNVYHEGATTRAVGLGTVQATSKDQPEATLLRQPPRRVMPLMMWQCGTEEHWNCDSYGGSGSCYNYYTPVYCDSGGGVATLLRPTMAVATAATAARPLAITSQVIRPFL